MSAAVSVAESWERRQSEERETSSELVWIRKLSRQEGPLTYLYYSTDQIPESALDFQRHLRQRPIESPLESVKGLTGVTSQVQYACYPFASSHANVLHVFLFSLEQMVFFAPSQKNSSHVSLLEFVRVVAFCTILWELLHMFLFGFVHVLTICFLSYRFSTRAPSWLCIRASFSLHFIQICCKSKCSWSTHVLAYCTI